MIGAPLWVQIALAVLGSAGVGGIIVKALDRWLDHKRDSRKQTDDIAMSTVVHWETRVLKVEADNLALRAEMKIEREKCEREMSELRHSFNNELMSSDTLIAMIRMAPERALEAVERIETVRALRRDEIEQGRNLRIAELRHAERTSLAQIRASAANVMGVGDGMGDDG